MKFFIHLALLLAVSGAIVSQTTAFTCVYWTSEGEDIEVHTTPNCKRRCKSDYRGGGECLLGECECDRGFFQRVCTYKTRDNHKLEVFNSEGCHNRCAREGRDGGYCDENKRCRCDRGFPALPVAGA